MTTDNRTDEPIEAMVLAGLNRVDWDAIRAGEADPREAAAHAIWHALQAAAQGAAPQADGENAAVARSIRIWTRQVRSELEATAEANIQLGEDYLHGIRSALMQAEDHAARLENDLYGDKPTPVLPSSTAPQAETYDHCCQHPKCPGGSLCCCVSEQRLRDCWNQWREEIAGDSKQAFRDGYQAGRNDPAPWLTAPGLSSSGVDEEKLADVVCLALNHRDGGEECEDDYRVARAVAEWLKGQER